MTDVLSVGENENTIILSKAQLYDKDTAYADFGWAI